MPKKPAHTPLPWEMDEFDGQVYMLGPKKKSKSGAFLPVYLFEATTRDSEGLFVSPKEQKANGEFIVMAVNNHAALVEALEETKSALSAWMEIADKEDERDSDYAACHKANAVLAKVKVK